MGALNCGTSIANITNFNCITDYGVINKVWLSPVQRLSTTFSNALSEATWTTEINKSPATRTFITQVADDAVMEVGEPLFKETNLTPQILIRKGIPTLELHFYNQRDCVFTAYKTFNGQKMFADFLTESDALIGKDDGTNFINVPVRTFTSEPIAPPNKDEPWMIKVFIQFINASDNFTKFTLPNVSAYNSGTLFSPSALEGIIDVTMTAEGTTTTTSADVIITGSCDGREIDEPLVTADFIVTLISSGAVISHTVAIVSGTSNVYNFSGLTAAPHLITMKDQPNATTPGYESQETLTVTPA